MQASGPLSGVTVLDLSSYLAGPYGCTLLADLGADVIKVEAPQGDLMRQYPSTLVAESRMFLGANRGKRGVVLDLKVQEGVAVLLRMAKEAEVLVHNFRPSVPARLGIDYPRLRQINPRLIYCALTGYGETGPLKDKAGFDQVLQAMTGICVFQGAPRGGPEIVAGSAVDYYAAALLAYGITAALFRRARTGEGEQVGVSLLRSALTMQAGRFVWAEGEPREIGRDMRSGGVTGLHPTKQGMLYLQANSAHFWNALCTMIGLAEMAEDPRYDTIRKRAQHAEEIVPRLRTALMARTALEWEAMFGDRVPCAAVRTIEDMFDHPQVLAEGMVADYDHPKVGRYRGLSGPLVFGAGSAGAPSAAPVLGQHTEEVLAHHGYTEEQIAQLRGLGAIA